MRYDKTVFEIFAHIAKTYPELLGELRSMTTSNVFAFERDISFKQVINYAKNIDCQLARLCDKYGSDKGSLSATEQHPYPWPPHTYCDYYARLWGHCRNSVKKVFECGLGTNNPSLPSSMGIKGRPGASLRVWRDYFPNATIYGADIDEQILFSEHRIQTYFIDQLKPEAIRQCWYEIGTGDFDFIVDDGLHTFQAGVSLFTHSISQLSLSGIYVIEDVNQVDLRKYKDYFSSLSYIVDYVSLYRPDVGLGDNNLVVVRKQGFAPIGI